MTGKTEVQNTQVSQGAALDAAKWLFVVVLMLAGVFGYHYFDKVSSIYRILALVPVFAVAIFVGLKTKRGEIFWGLMKGAFTEARRVVWPTRQEATQTTLVVMAVIFVMSLVLWALDSLFGKLVSQVIG